MTLSRRDEFATRALIAELDRTAPKPEPRPEIEDDGRDIEDERGYFVSLFSSDTAGKDIEIRADNPHLTISDARLFAHRIIKLCDEIEGGK